MPIPVCGHNDKHLVPARDGKFDAGIVFIIGNPHECEVCRDVEVKGYFEHHGVGA